MHDYRIELTRRRSGYEARSIDSSRREIKSIRAISSRCVLRLSLDSAIRAYAQYRTWKIVYRRYAGLFFGICVDANDNELAYLEAIHLFVEVLGAQCCSALARVGSHSRTDAFFGNV